MEDDTVAQVSTFMEDDTVAQVGGGDICFCKKRLSHFTYFLFLYLTRRTINNHTPHLKPPKNLNRRAALGRPAIKLLGLQLVCGRPALGFSSAMVPQTLSLRGRFLAYKCIILET